MAATTTTRGANAVGDQSPTEVLAFFDPELAENHRGPDLVRILLDDAFETSPVRIPADDEAALFRRLVYHRLVPQLRAALESGRIIAETDQLTHEVGRASMRQVVRGLQLEAMLVDVDTRFDEAGIEFRVLKGTATGHLDHAQAGLRQSADVDLLIRGDEAFEHAGEILAASGFVAPEREIRLMDKGETWRLSDECSVDLHRRLHTAGRPLPDGWWARSERFTVAGHEVLAFDRSGRMAHAASHYAVSYPNHRILSSLLDLLVIGRASSEQERRDATELLRQIGVGDIVRRITGRAAVLCGDERVVIGEYGRSPLDRALRRAYDRPDLDKVALKLAKTFGMPPRDQLRVLRNWIAPSEEFLAKGGYSSRWDRMTTVVRRRLSAGDKADA